MDYRDKVVVGYCHPTDVSAGFHDSLLSLVVHDFNSHQHVVNGGGRIARYSSANISNARNGIVRKFLDETRAGWLWMVDADMKFDPDTLDRMMDVAHPKRAPIVGGLCFGVDEGELFPTLYDLRDGDDGKPTMVRYNEYPPDTMFQVVATGAACILIHRSVLTALRDKFPEPWPWFAESIHNGNPMGEDVTFCLRAGLAGFPLFVHTGIEIGHAKTQVLTAELYRKQRATREVTE